jgi:hypothetical protein
MIGISPPRVASRCRDFAVGQESKGLAGLGKYASRKNYLAASGLDVPMLCRPYGTGSDSNSRSAAIAASNRAGGSDLFQPRIFGSHS